MSIFMIFDPDGPPPCVSERYANCLPLTTNQRHLDLAIQIFSVVMIGITIYRFFLVKRVKPSNVIPNIMAKASGRPGGPVLEFQIQAPKSGSKSVVVTTIVIAVCAALLALGELILNWQLIISNPERSMFWAETFVACLAGSMAQLIFDFFVEQKHPQHITWGLVALACFCAMGTFFNLYQQIGAIGSKLSAIYFAFVNGLAWKGSLPKGAQKN